MQDLNSLTRAQLLDLHNTKARELGLRELASFKDHASAVARTADILAQSDEEAQEREAQPATVRTYHDNDAARAAHRGFPSPESYRKYRDAKNAMKRCEREGDMDGAANWRAVANAEKRLARAHQKGA